MMLQLTKAIADIGSKINALFFIDVIILISHPLLQMITKKSFALKDLNLEPVMTAKTDDYAGYADGETINREIPEFAFLYYP